MEAPATIKAIPKKSKWRNFCMKFSLITVEPVIILYLFPTLLMSVSVTNLDLEKSCRVNLNYNATICDALTSRNRNIYTSEQENMVQKLVTTMTAWKNIIKGVVPAFLLLIIGAWSDKNNRRKPVIGLPITGEFITMIGFLVCTYFFYEIPMEVGGFFECVPPSITGGSSCFIMGIFSYVSAISTAESRTVRIGVAKMCTDVSMMLGSALGGIFFRILGLYGIFSLVLALYISGFIYLVFVIKEKSVECVNKQHTSKLEFLKDFYNIKHIKPTFIVAFKRRRRNYRARIIVCLVLMLLTLGPVYGENMVVYLFARKQFQYDEIQFSIFYTITMVVQLIGTLTSLTVFSKWLKLSDTAVGLISYIGKFFSVCLLGFAKTPLVLGIGILVGALSTTTCITVRSLATKMIPEKEIGRLNALMALLETLLPFLCGVMYTMVYRSTIDILPGAFYLIGGVLWFPTMILLGWLYVQQKRDLRENANPENVPPKI